MRGVFYNFAQNTPAVEYILISGIFMALLIPALLLAKQGKQKSDYILSAYFLLFAATNLFSFIEIYNRSHNYPFPAFINSSTPLIFLHGPMLWLYIKSLTVNNFKLKPLHLLHITPFALIVLLFSVILHSQPVLFRIEADQVNFRNHLSYPFVVAGIAISTQGYFIWGLLLLRNFNKKLRDWVSKTEGVDLQWLRFLIITAITAYASISILYAVDYRFGILPLNLLQPAGFAIASGFVIVLGFFGLKQGNIFVALPKNALAEEIQPQLPINQPLTDKDEKFVNDLITYMKTGKPFLDPELNISKMAAELEVTVEYLSGILNGKLHMNFFDFVNRYRIEEFRRLCSDPKLNHLSIMGLAFDCGFNSKATFNRVFKKATNLTPSEFRQMSQ